jgi:single-stranded DNA-binding protein
MAIALTSNPELKYTQVNQTSICEFVAEFQGGKPEDPPSSIKVKGWGKMADEIQQGYQLGDRAIVEGQIQVENIDRPEGFKEKRASIVVSKIHLLGRSQSPIPSPAKTQPKPVATPAIAQKPIPVEQSTVSDSDLDEIPF